MNGPLPGNISHARTKSRGPSSGMRATMRKDGAGDQGLPGRSVRSDEMFERFTDRARRGVVLAQEEARMLNHNYIGTEHILLGLIHEGEGVAAKALESLGISLEAVRRGSRRSGPAGASSC